MRTFSISELEQYSDIKAHTIRTWEKRYSLFTPLRNDGNLRRYSLENVESLLNIGILLEYGARISGLANVDAGEIKVRVAALKAEAARQKNRINKLIICMFRSDTEAFEAVLDEAVMAWGIEGTVTNIILPFLERVQLLSYKSSGIETHLAVTAVRRKLIMAIEKTGPVSDDAKTAILFLPKNEHYDLILLYMNYALRKAGIKVLYLGTDISIENLVNISTQKKPDFLYSYVASKNNFPIADYIDLISIHLPQSYLYIGYATSGHKINGIYPACICFIDYKKVGTV